MGKEIVQNEKQLVSGIVKAFNRMESAKKGYVYSVIELGEKLIQAKEIVPFGQWEKWLKAHSEFAFGMRQAQKFMQVYDNKILVLEYFSAENTVDNLTKAIADATPEQLEKAEQLKLAEEQRIKKAEEEKAAKSAVKDDVIEGSFKEVKAEIKKEQESKEPEPDYERMELQESVNILSYRNDEIEAELKSISKIFDSNDKLATAAAEIKKLTAVNAGLESQVRSYQAERTELIRTSQMWRKKYEKLAKETGKE